MRKELSVHSRSKGRRPCVFVFNPFAEGYIALGKSFTPVKQQVLLARDLQTLPQFLCRQEDIVLVEQRPSVQFLSQLRVAGFSLPEFVSLGRPDPVGAGSVEGETEPRAQVTAGLANRRLGGLRPWAWSPDSPALLQPLGLQLARTGASEPTGWNPAFAKLYSKAWSADFLRTFLSQQSAEPWLCAAEEVGTAARSLEEALRAVESIRQRGHHKVVVKEAIGLAGHNAIRLWEPQILEAQRRWIATAAQGGRVLVVEPWLEREVDFSVQLEMGEDGLEVRGYTGLLNDRKGQYQGNWTAPNYERRIPAKVTSLFREVPDAHERFAGLYGRLFAALEPALRGAGYQGPVGVDAFVYRSAGGECRLKPVVEINPRCTMGRVAVELMRQTAPGSCGLFRIVNRAMASAEGFRDFVSYARALSERAPIQLEGEPTPRIREGALCLTDPARAESCIATLQVSRSVDALLNAGLADAATSGANR